MSDANLQPKQPPVKDCSAFEIKYDNCITRAFLAEIPNDCLHVFTVFADCNKSAVTKPKINKPNIVTEPNIVTNTK